MRNTYVKFNLQDEFDECLPFEVTGQWVLHYSDEEALESSIENSLAEELNPENFLEENIHETSKDEFLDEIEHSGWVTAEQQKMLEEMAEENLIAAEKIRKKAEERFAMDHV